MVIKADVSNEADIKRMADEVIARWGRIDILVNNAGIVLPANAENCSLDDWRAPWRSISMACSWCRAQWAGR